MWVKFKRSWPFKISTSAVWLYRYDQWPVVNAKLLEAQAEITNLKNALKTTEAAGNDVY